METSALLKRGFAVWWRYKVLWGLGMLLAVVGRGGYGVTINTGTLQPSERLEDTAIQSVLAVIPDNITPETVTGWLASLGLILLAIWVVLLFVGSIVESATIVQTDALAQRGQFDLNGSFAAGVSRMVPLALMDLILAIPGLVVGIGIFAAFAGLVSSAVEIATAGPSASMLGLAVTLMLGVVLCLLLPIGLWGLFLAVFRPLAARACVLERQGPVASIKRGWQVLRRNLGQAIVIWLVTFGIGLIYSVPVGAIAGMVLFATDANLLTSLSAWLVIIGLLNLIFAVIVGGLLTSLNVTLWTVGYRQWTMAAPTMQQVYAPES
ncbi:MAG: hypothetical protein ACK44M_11450 [Chloroflexus sp.]